jgi:hypothetical protein
MGNVTLFKYKEDRKELIPKLRDTYLPAAVFVPMYGRMMLYNVLHKLGKRVVMCDTDSVIYDPVGLVDDIETGDTLGDWEEEPGEIIGFVGIAPKSYGLKYADGSSVFKTKGLCLKRSHQATVNYETARLMVLSRGEYVIPVAQMSFDFTPGKPVCTRKYLKELKFNPSGLKGIYDYDEFYLYPFGYEF